MLCIPPAQLKKMGTEGENTEGFTSLPEHPPEERGRDLPPSDEVDLIDRFQNVGLYPHYDSGGGSDSSATATATLLPLRPYAVDCAFYLKTGVCKFGAQCRYNHPLNRDASAVKDSDWKNQEKSTQHVQCKYQFSPGGCKFGSLCRYRHSAIGSDSAAPALNFIGLPKREGEKECPYFMRNGSCSYGANCVYHHPEPSSIGKDKSMRKTFAPLDCESALLQLSDAARNHQAAPWLSSPLSRSPLSFRDGYSHPTIVNSFRHLEYPEPNPYQAPQFPCQRISVHLIPGAKRLDNLPLLPYGAVEQYPERPGQPECAYFMKTGDCKFKVACRYHHPKYQHECLLSEKGLPLRPGRNICRHFQSFGVCKFGRACLFDHPISHDPSNVQKWFYPEPAPAHDDGGFRNE